MPGDRVGHHRVQGCGLHHAGDREGVHRERRDDLALGIAAGHDAGCGALGCAHAVTQHHDDVLDLLAASQQRDDFEVAFGRHSLAVALGRA